MKEYMLPIRFGVATSGCLIAYFLVLSLFGVHTNAYYSVFNVIITGFGIYEVIKYLKVHNGMDFGYSQGFMAGMVTGSVATVIFTFFFAVYATEINTGFLKELSGVWFKRKDAAPGIVFFTVAIMGFATTLVLTLAFMQLFKVSNNLKRKPS